MNFSKTISAVLLFTVSVMVPTFSFADEREVLSSELTTLYRAARKVISVNQKHINDASKGDKGLSAAEVLSQTKSNYADAAGQELDMAANTEVKQAMLDAVSNVMDEAQELINQEGVGFKGFLPAIFARQVATKFSATMKGAYKIKLTAPKKYVRNRANRPDKWENNVIDTVFSKDGYEKGKPFSEVASVKGKDAYRYILPEYYGESCLGCHGKPKGERDITGGKKEGGVLGELGGAISLVIFN